MRVINIRKKSIYILTSFICFIVVIFAFTYSFGMQNYYNVGFSTGLVTATKLNVRSGPGTNYDMLHP